jgi:hypothetical protein
MPGSKPDSMPLIDDNGGHLRSSAGTVRHKRHPARDLANEVDSSLEAHRDDQAVDLVLA